MALVTIKKIALVSSLFPPDGSAQAQYFYYLAQELAELGIKVHVITLWGGDSCGTKAVGGFDVSCIPYMKLPGGGKYVLPKHYKHIKAEIESFKPDCIVTDGYISRLGFLAAKAAFALSIPCLSISHIIKPPEHRVKFIDTLKKRHELYMLHLHKKMRAVLAGAGDMQAAHLKFVGAVPRYTIPYGILTDIVPLPVARKRLGISENVVLYCINMDDGGEKHLLETAQALDAIRSYSGPDIVLCVIGKKPKEMVFDKKNFVFTGDIAYEEELSVKYASDVYIYCAGCAPQHTKLMEAGLMQCACIVVEEEGARCSLVESGETGIAVSAYGEEFKAALQKLRVHKKLRGEISEKLKLEVELKHSWHQSALALMDAAWELCGGRRRSAN